MRVTLLYFAVVRELLGVDREEAELPPGVRTVRDLTMWLEAERAPLAGRLGPVRFAVDECFAGPDEALHDGAVVALIPPVAGG